MHGKLVRWGEKAHMHGETLISFQTLLRLLLPKAHPLHERMLNTLNDPGKQVRWRALI